MSQKSRIVDIMITSLVNDKLILEQSLEETSNGPLPIEEKLVECKRILKEILLTEQMVPKWNYYTTEEVESEETEEKK